MSIRTVLLLSLLAYVVESSKQVKCVHKEKFVGYDWKYAKSCFALITISEDCGITVNYGAAKHTSSKPFNKVHFRLHSDDYTTISYECKTDFCNIDKEVIMAQLKNLNYFSSDADLTSQTTDCKKALLKFADRDFLTPVNEYVERQGDFFKSDVKDLVQKVQSQNALSKLLLNPETIKAIKNYLAESETRQDAEANYGDFMDVIGGEKSEARELKSVSETWTKKIFGTAH